MLLFKLFSTPSVLDNLHIPPSLNKRICFIVRGYRMYPHVQQEGKIGFRFTYKLPRNLVASWGCHIHRSHHHQITPVPTNRLYADFWFTSCVTAQWFMARHWAGFWGVKLEALRLNVERSSYLNIDSERIIIHVRNLCKVHRYSIRLETHRYGYT